MSKKTTKHHNPSVFLKKQSECDKGTIFPKDRQSFVPSTRYSLVQNSKPTTPTASRIKFALKSCPENCGPSLSTPRRPRKKLRKTHPKILGSPDRDTYFAADSSLANSMSSRLLSLPAEIRFIIWELALTSDSGELHFDSKTKRFDVSSIGAGLLTTCSETAYETQYLPLKLNKLVFEVPTKVNVDFMVFLRRLKRIEDSLGWIMDINVKFKQKAENKGKKDDITVEMSPVMTRGTAG